MSFAIIYKVLGKEENNMKEWNKPELMSLNVQSTNAGGLGGDGDGVHYNVYGEDLIGTSGPALNIPVVGEAR